MKSAKSNTRTKCKKLEERKREQARLVNEIYSKFQLNRKMAVKIVVCVWIAGSTVLCRRKPVVILRNIGQVWYKCKRNISNARSVNFA